MAIREASTMSKRRTGYWLLAAGALALAVFAAPRLARGDRDDSDKLLDHYLRAYNNGDPAALAELYTEDALFLPHEGPSSTDAKGSRTSGGAAFNLIISAR